MKKKTKVTIKKRAKDQICTRGRNPDCGSGLYFFGFLGAVIYYISTSTGFWSGVLGILKSFVWPAFLVFELLKFLGV